MAECARFDLETNFGAPAALATMAALGIDSEEDLFLLMTQARLPMPRLPAATTQGTLNELNTLAT